MAYMIKPQETTYFPKRNAQKKASYLAFLRKLPCAVTGVHGVEAAHVSYASPQYGAYGRGKGSKVSDRFALPLSPDKHREQHSMREEAFWRKYEINPHVLALTIWGLWTEMEDDAEEYATAIIMQGKYQPW